MDLYRGIPDPVVEKKLPGYRYPEKRTAGIWIVKNVSEHNRIGGYFNQKMKKAVFVFKTRKKGMLISALYDGDCPDIEILVPVMGILRPRDIHTPVRAPCPCKPCPEID
jgi:hypothetical protein